MARERIFLGLTEVSGYFSRLELGLRELGMKTTRVALQGHRFAYSPKADTPAIVRLASWCASARAARAGSHTLSCAWWLLATAASRLILLIWALARHDVFILGAGSSFFGFRDLRFIRLFGRKLIYTLHGTDSRPPFIDGAFLPSHYNLADPEGVDGDVQTHASALADAHRKIAALRKAWVGKIEQAADVVVCGPCWGQYLSRPFVNFIGVGIPMPQSVELGKAAGIDFFGQMPGCRILHAPSYSRFKGTTLIQQIIAELQGEGLAINYLEISNRPNQEVLAALAQADILVDQAYSDTPMAGLAAEAALFGVPAVLGGYCSDADFGALGRKRPPSAYCRPEDMKQTIRRLVEEPQARRELGQRAQVFVTTQWTPAAVAAHFAQIIRGQIDPTLMVQPADLAYTHGGGLTEAQSRANISALIKRHGVAALQLDHNPDLQEAFTRYASKDGSC